MLPVKLVYPAYDETPETKLMIEQCEYLRGVLFADKENRMDKDLSRDIGKEIDPYGTGTQHFWRGLIETGGYIALESAGNYASPQLVLKGGYRLLRRFLDFVEEELGPRSPAPRMLGAEVKWDADGKLDFQARGGFISLGGTRAQEVVNLLYAGATISRDTYRYRANRIFHWVSKKRWP